MKSIKIEFSDLLIMIVAFFWSVSTIISKPILADTPVFEYLAIRFGFAFLTLSIIYHQRLFKTEKSDLQVGTISGAFLFGSYVFGVGGLAHTSAGNATFIQALSVIIIPFLDSMLHKKIPNRFMVASVTFCLGGLWLLTGGMHGSSFNLGDLLCLLCALIYSVYTIYIGQKTQNHDFARLAAIQIFVIFLLSLLSSYFLEDISLHYLTGNLPAFLFVGVFCTALITVLQLIGQRNTSPTRVGIILLLEPVVVIILAYFFLSESRTWSELGGCLLIIAGLLLAEIKHI